MVANSSSMHPSTYAVSYDTNFSEGPNEAGSDWASDEGTTAHRMRHHVAEPDNIRVTFIEDPSLTDAITETNDPINGIRTFDGVPCEIPLGGSEEDTAATMQVTESAVMKWIEAWMGGMSRGYTSAITLVNSQTDYDLTTATGMDEGVQYGFQDADDTTKIYGARVISSGGAGNAVFDRAPPFTATTSDLLKAFATGYIDEDALSNPSDASVKHLSILIIKGGKVWEGLGCRFECSEIVFPRNGIPKMVGNISGAYANVPGDGAPAAPIWTASVQGQSGKAVGANHELYIQDVGTTTRATYDLVAGSGVLRPGLPRPRHETSTEDTDRAQGTAGFTLGKGESIFECQVFLDTGFQDDWDTKQKRIVSYTHHGSGGTVWFVNMPNAVLMDPPQRIGGQESNLYTMRFKGRQDRSLDSVASNTNLSRSRFTLAQG